MKKYILLILSLLLITTNSLAYTPPSAPADGTYVVDKAGVLSAEQIAALNLKIEATNKETKNEFGILIVSDMDGDDIEDVANATFKSWHIGKAGLDNGCLIVIAIKERKSRIETGKGVEGEVTDLQANDILLNHLNPYLKRRDFFGGLNETLDALSALITHRAGPASSKTTEADESIGLIGEVVIGGLIFFAIILLVAARKARGNSYSNYGSGSSSSSSSSFDFSSGSSDSSSSSGGDSGFGGGDSGGGGSSSSW